MIVNVAFGDDPGRWPLPEASSAEMRWLRAVAAGGQGRYAIAFTELAFLRRTQRAGRLASLAHSTHASFLRQLGWHADARRWDGRAVAVADGDPEALGDGLIGLAADALGVGRFAASSAALGRTRCLLQAAAPRVAVRMAWVSAELAMATGDGAAAVGHAEHATRLAAGLGSARHRVKSDVVLAAALCCDGRVERSREVADAALTTSQGFGFVPLSWALACLLCDIGSGKRTDAQVVGIRDLSADTVRRRGGVLFRR
jgi:hypothetical protein